MTTDGKSPSALAFLTIVERDPHGLFGGLLLLNPAGRPLEFHCTAPIKPNRAQQILYGPTLLPFLYGEHIGGALARKCSLAPLVIFTNQSAALSLRSVVEVPVCCVEADEPHPPESPVEPSDRQWRIDAPHAAASGAHVRVSFAGHILSCDPRWRDDAASVQQRLSDVAADFDLLEPFTRIAEAIDEAQRATR